MRRIAERPIADGPAARRAPTDPVEGLPLFAGADRAPASLLGGTDDALAGGPPRVAPTSRDALTALSPHRASMEARVLQYFRTHPEGRTRKEAEADLGMKHQTVTARIRDLIVEGVLTETRLRRDGSLVVTVAPPTLER